MRFEVTIGGSTTGRTELLAALVALASEKDVTVDYARVNGEAFDLEQVAADAKARKRAKQAGDVVVDLPANAPPTAQELGFTEGVATPVVPTNPDGPLVEPADVVDAAPVDLGEVSVANPDA
jgi:hypothetical protein